MLDFRARGLDGFADDLFQHADVFQESTAALFRHANERQRAASLIAFPNLDESRFLQNLHVPVEVPVGQAAERFELGKEQPLRVGDQRTQDAKPRFLMQDAVEPVEEKANGPESDGSGFDFFITSLQRAVQNECSEKLSKAKRRRHHPGRQ